MDFVENAIVEFWRIPVAIGPLERLQVDDFGWAVNTLRLKPRCGIWIFLRVVELVEVPGMRFYIVYHNLMVAAFILVHWDETITRAEKMQCNFLPAGGPHGKLPISVRSSICARTNASARIR